MILLYPVLLAVALAIVATTDSPRGRGWGGFAAWSASGALFTFSFLTGLSIGLLLLPLAAAALLLTAIRSPHFAEAVGFSSGIGAVAILVAGLNWGERDGASDAGWWLVAGIVAVSLAVLVYGRLHTDRARSALMGGPGG